MNRIYDCFQCAFAIFNQQQEQQNGTNNRHKAPTQN